MKICSLTARDVAAVGLMAATLEAGKMALNFLPNIEVVTLLLVVYTLQLGRRALYASLIFVGLECLVWGVGVWTAMYLYLWPLLTGVTYLLRRQTSHWFWILFCAVYGLLFGLLGSVPYIFLGGIKGALAWWAAGIPYDLAHCAGNFCLALLLFRPLSSLLTKIAPRITD